MLVHAWTKTFDVDIEGGETERRKVWQMLLYVARLSRARKQRRAAAVAGRPAMGVCMHLASEASLRAHAI